MALRYRDDKIDLLEILLARHPKEGPLAQEDLKTLLPKLYSSGHFSDVRADLSSPKGGANRHGHGYILAGCYVIEGQQHKLGLRLHDRDEAQALLDELVELRAAESRRGRRSALAG